MKRRIPPSRRQLQMSHAVYAPSEKIQKSIIEEVDAIAFSMERKWGIGRLRLLVSEDLRARFDAQADKFNAALETGQESLLSVQAEGMKRAWQFLDKAATAEGKQPMSAEVWEIRLPKSGRIVAVIRTSEEAHLVQMPERETWTLQEISHLIEHAGHLVGDIKRTYPGAEIKAIHGQTNTEPFDWKKGDDIPF